MGRTYSSPAVREKHRLQSRKKHKSKNWRGCVCVFVCVCVCQGVGGVADFNAWSEAGIIDFNTK